MQSLVGADCVVVAVVAVSPECMLVSTTGKKSFAVVVAFMYVLEELQHSITRHGRVVTQFPVVLDADAATLRNEQDL